MASKDQEISNERDQKEQNPEDQILQDPIIYLPCAVTDLKTIGEIAQNYIIVRSPENEEKIRQEFVRLFTKVKSD